MSLKPEGHTQGHLEAPAASVEELEGPPCPAMHKKQQQEVLTLPSAAGGSEKPEGLCM